MYCGIFENKGKKVMDCDAFPYACEMVQQGENELKGEFMEIANSSQDFVEFSNRLVEWFFSGSWRWCEDAETL